MASDTPFETIESALEYVTLLARQVEDVGTGIVEDISTAAEMRASRRVDALRLVDYKLRQLTTHLAASRRILNDLRMLRRVVATDGHHTAAVTREFAATSEPEWDAFV
jgi:hypothetical protein